jgi:hypothetical protein
MSLNKSENNSRYSGEINNKWLLFIIFQSIIIGEIINLI